MNTNDLYLNHAATSWPKPDRVLDAVREAMNASPVVWARQFEEAHQAIANFFGVQEPEQILFTPGCTSSLAIAIGDAWLGDRKRILTSGWEHHALHRPLLKLAASGVSVDYIPPSKRESNQGQPGAIDLDWLERSLARNDVGLVAITAACNVTGELLPYEEVIRLAHQYESLVLLDAAQIVGWQSLELPALGADLVAFGGHKGLQAPWGIGGLYLSDRARMECVSANCDVLIAGKESGGKESGRQSPRPGYCDVGSVDQVALAGLRAAVEWSQEKNTKDLLATGRRQIKRIRTSLDPIDDLQVYGPADPSSGMPTLAFAVAGHCSVDVAARLRSHRLIVGSGLQCAPLAHQSLGTQDSGLVRLSVGRGQPDHEIDEAIERLKSALNVQW